MIQTEALIALYHATQNLTALTYLVEHFLPHLLDVCEHSTDYKTLRKRRAVALLAERLSLVPGIQVKINRPCHPNNNNNNGNNNSNGNGNSSIYNNNNNDNNNNSNDGVVKMKKKKKKTIQKNEKGNDDKKNEDEIEGKYIEMKEWSSSLSSLTIDY